MKISLTICESGLSYILRVVLFQLTTSSISSIMDLLHDKDYPDHDSEDDSKFISNDRLFEFIFSEIQQRNEQKPHQEKEKKEQSRIENLEIENQNNENTYNLENIGNIGNVGGVGNNAVVGKYDSNERQEHSKDENLEKVKTKKIERENSNTASTSECNSIDEREASQNEVRKKRKKAGREEERRQLNPTERLDVDNLPDDAQNKEQAEIIEIEDEKHEK